METKQKVERLFKHYGEQKQSLEILGFQILNFVGAKDDEVIEALNFAVPEGERVSTSSLADKSARIALMYKDQVDRESQEMFKGMAKRYITQKNELALFEYCITLLEKRLSEVIKDIVINKMSWADAAEKYNVSVNAIGDYRKKAIKELTKMLEPSCLSSSLV